MLSGALLLSGCAEQRIRTSADEAIQRGAYEQGLQSLDAGLKDHPDSVLLRSGLLRAKQDVLDALLREMQRLQNVGDVPGAQRVLDRALAIDPDNPRLRALRADLDIDARQRGALAEARALVEKNRPDLALTLVSQALQDNPRQPELLALRRKLEDDARSREYLATREVLAQSRPISLDFRDASLRTVLDLISRHSGVNYVVDRDVRPDLRVSLLLKDAQVDDALNLLLTTNQLTKKVVDARTIVVYPNSKEKAKEYEEQVVRVFYLSSGDARGAASFLRAMLKVADPFVDERTNMLALRDSIETIRLAERLIGLYDAVEPEVLLELEVLEVNTRRLTELGVKLPDSFSLTPLPPAGDTRLTLGNIANFGRDRVALGIGGLLVNLKREVGDFSTLANPRIRVKNREKAKVLVGDKVPVISTVTGQTGFVSDSISYLDVGLKLEVEPAIYADDDVGIKVALEVSTLGTATRTAAGALAYQIGTRNASTWLRLRDGETQLLAGLISKDERTSASRLPGAGDLPVLGRLFSSTSDNSQKTELVLAITPRVLRNVQRPSASESEIWIGTEARPALRAPRPPASAASQPDAAKASGPANAAPTPGLVQDTNAMPAVSPGGGGSPAINAPVLLTPLKLGWSGPSTVALGQVATFSLVAEHAADLRALPMELGFDSQYWAFVAVEEGDLLSQQNTPTTLVQNGSAESGAWGVSLIRKPATGANGEGRVLHLKLRALRTGDTAVAVRSAKPLSARAEPSAIAELPMHRVRITPSP